MSIYSVDFSSRLTFSAEITSYMIFAYAILRS